MKHIKILDCTLRDGGYVNNWDFGVKTKEEILNALCCSRIDIVECGLLVNEKNISSDKTLYNSIEDINKLLPTVSNTEFSVMVNYGVISIDKYPKCFSNIEIRLAFKPHELKNALKYSEELIEKGYKISLNPMHTSLYSDNELKTLVSGVNRIKPRCLTVVDTMGIMTEKDTETLFKNIDKSLDKGIAIGFHSHNNMNLSLKNTKKLLNMNLNRDIIIDSCLAGMGRGAGILKTEDISELLNKYFEKDYNIKELHKISNKHINSMKHLWEWQEAYYISAQNKCHPNYAKFIIDNMSILRNDTIKINELLRQIPDNNKIIYNQDIIKSLIEEKFKQ
ncbi:MAG: hypothetical protein NC200_02570 [Candidatus Gastranaerophilales bacterium]|nr:hypothetical protein [Candidatus Gastranaerophilales bacterium]